LIPPLIKSLLVLRLGVGELLSFLSKF